MAAAMLFRRVRAAGVAAVLLCVGAMLLWSAAASAFDSPQRRKARYFYMAGVHQQALGNDAEAFEMYKRAFNTDPSYVEAATAYATERMTRDSDQPIDRQYILESLELMRPFIDKYAGDYFESQYYAYIAGRVDTLAEAVRVYQRLDSIYPTRTETLLRLADTYMVLDSLPRAIDYLNRYEEIEGRSPQLSLRKISYSLSKRDSVGALREATALADWNPRDAGFQLLKGNVFEAMEKPDSALVYYLRAEELNPESGAVKMSLANFYKNRGDSVAYDTKIYEALLSEDYDLEAKTALLADYLQQLILRKDNTARGDTLFEVLHRQFPHEPQVLGLSARYNAAKGNFAAAREDMDYATSLEPENPEYWNLLMSYYLADDDGENAEKVYDRAAEHITPDEDMKLLRGSARTARKDYPGAIRMYEELIQEVAPNMTVADSLTEKSLNSKLTYEDLQRLSVLYSVVGDTYYQWKKLPETFRSYDNSLFLLPSNVMTLNNYAYFLTETGGDLERALKMSKQAVEAASDNSTYLDTYAWVLFKLGRYDEALAEQKKAIEIAEKEGDASAELYEHYGDILFWNKEPQEAVVYWEKALELEPDKEVLKRKVKDRTYHFDPDSAPASAAPQIESESATDKTE